MAAYISLIVFLASSSSVLARPCPGLRIGLSPDTAEIAVNGTVTTPWSEADGPRLAAYVYNFTFYVSYDLSDSLPVTIDAKTGEVDPNSYYVYPARNTGVLGPNDTTSLRTNLGLFCYFRTSNDTFTEVNVTVPGFDSIVFIFKKACELPMVNIEQVEGPTIFWNNTMIDRYVIPILGGDASEIDYNIYLQDNSIARVLPFVVRTHSLDEVDVFLDYVGDNMTWGQNVTVLATFVCTNDTATYNATINFTLDIHYSSSFVWTVSKICIPPPPSSGGGGWSTAGIFFFSVFIIIVVFCVAGCGYNFIKNEKTGFDVVPGASYYRACYEKVFPVKHYTPQLDNRSDLKDSSAKSYGSTTYQDNL